MKKSKWRERPFDPTSEAAEPDAEICQLMPGDFDPENPNWDTVAAHLWQDCRIPEERLPTLTLSQIRQHLTLGRARFLNLATSPATESVSWAEPPQRTSENTTFTDRTSAWIPPEVPTARGTLKMVAKWLGVSPNTLSDHADKKLVPLARVKKGVYFTCVKAAESRTPNLENEWHPDAAE